MSNNPLLPILIVIVGVVAGYLYYASLDTAIVLIEDPKLFEQNDFDQLESLNFDFSIFDTNALRDFQSFGEHPVEGGQTGRRDFFAPI